MPGKGVGVGLGALLKVTVFFTVAELLPDPGTHGFARHRQGSLRRRDRATRAEPAFAWELPSGLGRERGDLVVIQRSRSP